MKHLPIQERLVLLLLAIVVLCGAGLTALKRSQEGQVAALLAERAEATGKVFDRLVELRSKAFALHAADYSQWDEFVQFAATPHTTWSRNWAETNLHQGTMKFSVSAVWALDRNFKVVYANRDDGGPVMPVPPVFPNVLRDSLARQPFRHFYARTPEGVLELWSAPVQPNADTARATPPAGYYLISRFLTAAVLKDLSEQADGSAVLRRISVVERRANARDENGDIVVRRGLAGLDGSPVALLNFKTRYALIDRVQANSRTLLMAMGIGALLLLLGTYTLLWYWVGLPLQTIQRGLESESSANLTSVLARRDELGNIARLVAAFFAQREVLVGEVETRKQAEREIAVQEALIHAVIDADTNAIYVVDRNRRLVLANTSAMSLFSAVPLDAAVRGGVDSLLDGLGCGESFRRAEADLRATGRPQACAETVTLANGSVRHYQSVRCAVPGPAGESHTLTVSIDVTGHIRQEALLSEARDAAESGARAKSQFLANISHELRTPMHGILSYARFGLREWRTAERHHLNEYFENIHQCGEGLLELLNDLLDLAKFESGKMTFEFGDVVVTDLVERAVDEFSPLLDERGIRVDVDAPIELPTAYGDHARLLQVLRNLLSNAAKFSPEGTLITITARAAGAYMRFSVEDQGPGIPAEELESIFNHFVQASHNRTGAGGTGLGLAICREIAEAHGGRIWAENRDEGGSRMCVEIPLGTDVAAPDEAPADRPGRRAA